MLVYLLEKKGWSSHRLQNLTTDSHGVASFSLNTTTMPKEDINLIVSMIPSKGLKDSETLYAPSQITPLTLHPEVYHALVKIWEDSIGIISNMVKLPPILSEGEVEL